MRSDSYKSHPKSKTTTTKIRPKSLWHFLDIPVCSAGRIQPAVGWNKNKPSRNIKFFKTRLEKLIKIMLLRRVLRETELHRQNYMFSRFGWGVLFSKGKNCSCSKANWCHLVSPPSALRGAGGAGSPGREGTCLLTARLKKEKKKKMLASLEEGGRGNSGCHWTYLRSLIGNNRVLIKVTDISIWSSLWVWSWNHMWKSFRVVVLICPWIFA